ncbi:helix-turn-helix domain-containing protein [Lactobacillus johnsonii]|jgi:predicted DNA-binding protein YlxM (UPF0122 family)|uniref:helix-turn-helix domain-containing protein n=1 Tax=Lactobacillus johnsonii TaxID=33959 RepID=UPI0028FC1055|nr:helix-turn-helix domain-containing protein [Lactobacillus johnsonii]MCI6882731.1 helix-turn-helix domain-containing protein [Lactobacillus johnsonii]MDY2873828.1 helix-turn-helix domain-containing protein [Lactobacillus johnsonii]WNW28080.1 helix-turn-helix domain-containing protein [Lactobacillus johnsonii]
MTIEYLGFKEAMDYLGIKSHKTLNKYIAEGLPVIEVSKSKKISKTAIDKFMKDHEVITTSQENI